MPRKSQLAQINNIAPLLSSQIKKNQHHQKQTNTDPHPNHLHFILPFRSHLLPPDLPFLSPPANHNDNQKSPDFWQLLLFFFTIPVIDTIVATIIAYEALPLFLQFNSYLCNLRVPYQYHRWQHFFPPVIWNFVLLFRQAATISPKHHSDHPHHASIDTTPISRIPPPPTDRA